MKIPPSFSIVKESFPFHGGFSPQMTTKKEHFRLGKHSF